MMNSDCISREYLCKICALSKKNNKQTQRITSHFKFHCSHGDGIVCQELIIILLAPWKGDNDHTAPLSGGWPLQFSSLLRMSCAKQFSLLLFLGADQITNT